MKAVNVRGVLFLLGRLLLGLAAVLLLPAIVAALLGEAETDAFLLAAGVTGGIGLIVERSFRHHVDAPFQKREAFLLVTSTWVMASIFGALPYIFIKGPGFLVDGLFESASGFTTTGASILTDIEVESAALLLWRSLTQWLGGMGIIVLGIAVLPKLATGGMQLLGAEAPGPVAEKLTPRLAQTAKVLWGIYMLLTGTLAVVLMALGMSPIDAVNHALTTMATGGFSTQNASAGAYGPAIQVVITVFMLIAGMNFALHFQLLRGKPMKMLRDPELRFYLGLIAVVSLLLTTDLLVNGDASNPLTALRLAAFQCVSIVTTTGFATADYNAWPEFARAALFVLMFVGGCAGSTGGSVKVVRILIVLKKIVAELNRMLRPHAVAPVRLGDRAIPAEVVNQVTTFFLLFVGLFVAGGLLLAATGLDPISAFSASATCIGNVGPGLEQVGPTHNMSGLPVPAKLILLTLMIVGRLELYTVLVIPFLFSTLRR